MNFAVTRQINAAFMFSEGNTCVFGVQKLSLYRRIYSNIGSCNQLGAAKATLAISHFALAINTRVMVLLFYQDRNSSVMSLENRLVGKISPLRHCVPKERWP